MSEKYLRVALIGLLTAIGHGCSHFVETRPIERFTEALATNDLDALKAASSEDFERKALRIDAAAEDIKLLRIPTDEQELSILKIEQVSPDQKLVTAEVGPRKRKVRYRLTRQPDSRQWVVDDILVRQRREGLEVTKSVTEQMDLLLAVREFLEAWRTGRRDRVLSVTTPEFGELLSRLPQHYLDNLTKRAVGDRASSEAPSPEVRMDEDVAVVQLDGPEGKIIISYRLLEDGWKVSDLAVESRRDGRHIPSVVKMATVARTTLAFLDTFARQDKPALAGLCTERFFNESLAPADLGVVDLPGGADTSSDYEITLLGRRADVVLRDKNDVMTINLVRSGQENPGFDEAEMPEYRVDEVVIYELDSRQEMRLSALFTADAVMRIFSEALRQRNLPLLRKTATGDFNKRVWDRIDEAALRQMPIQEIADAPPRVVSTAFEGAVTQITVMQGDRALTYVLRDHDNQQRVDDVHVPVVDRPTSLKTTLEVMIPIHNFIMGIDNVDLSLLQRNSSSDLNRLVWSQADTLPPISHVARRHLNNRLSSITLGPEGALVTLGEATQGAQVALSREYGKYVVDDVLLMAGVEPSQRKKLKHAMRLQVTSRGLQLARRRHSTGRRSSLDGAGPIGRNDAFSDDRNLQLETRDAVPVPVVAPIEETFGTAAATQ